MNDKIEIKFNEAVDKLIITVKQPHLISEIR